MADHPDTPQEVHPIDHTGKRNDYVELRIPRPVFTDVAFSPILILLLVALAFLLGMQTAKVSSYDKALAQAPVAPANPDPNAPPALGAKVDVNVGDLPTLGNKKAKVTMIEFADFQCPFCKRFYDDTFSQLKKDYVDTGKVQFAYRNEPLDIHPNAPKAAEAAECANDQGKFWEMHNALFGQYDSWANEPQTTLPDKLTAVAQSIGLNADAFTNCLTSGKYTQKVATDAKAGQAAGANGTPTFFINGQILVGALPYDTFKTLLDQELKK